MPGNNNHHGLIVDKVIDVEDIENIERSYWLKRGVVVDCAVKLWTNYRVSGGLSSVSLLLHPLSIATTLFHQ